MKDKNVNSTSGSQKIKKGRSIPVMILTLYSVFLMWVCQDGRFTLLDDTQIDRYIPGYSKEPYPQRKRLLKYFVKKKLFKVRIKVNWNGFIRNTSGKIPRRKKKPRKARKEDFQTSARVFCSLFDLFSIRSVGVELMENILCGLVCTALKKPFPDATFSAAIEETSAEIISVFKAIARAVVTKAHQKHKHIRFCRKPVLQFDSGIFTPCHIRDFAYAELTWKKKKAYAPLPYQNTFAMLLYAKRKQYKEALPSIQDCFSLLIGCDLPSDYSGEILSVSNLRYNSELLLPFREHRYEVSALLDKWQRKRLKDPRWIDTLLASTHRTGGVASPPFRPLADQEKALPAQIRTAILKDFLSYIKENGYLSDEEADARITSLTAPLSTEDSGPGKPPSDSAEAVIAVMKRYVAEHGDGIVPDGTPASAVAAKSGVWRYIAGKTQTTFLMLTEPDFATLYRQLAKEYGFLPNLSANYKEWLEKIEKDMRSHGFNKVDGSSFRFRYKLIDTWKVEDYVVAIDSNYLIPNDF